MKKNLMRCLFHLNLAPVIDVNCNPTATPPNFGMGIKEWSVFSALAECPIPCVAVILGNPI